MMANLQILFLCGAAVLYTSAALLYLYHLQRQAISSHPLLPLSLAAAGLLLQTALLGITAVQTAGTQLGGANILMLASWTTMVIYFFFELISRHRSYGAFLLPLILTSMIIAWVLNAGGLNPNGMAIYASWPLLVVHIVAYFAAAAIFLFGGVSSIMYLYQERLLKAKRKDALEARMPGLSFLKKVMRRSAPVGLLILAFGLTLGIMRAVSLDHAGWWMSLRIILSLVVFIMYCVITIQAYLIKSSAQTIAILHVLGSFLVLILLVFSAFLPMLGTLS